jgi:hypothetical protein
MDGAMVFPNGQRVAAEGEVDGPRHAAGTDAGAPMVRMKRPSGE